MREESEGIGSGQLRNAILGIERHRLSDACIPLTVVQYECCITFQRPACRNSVWNLQQSARLYVVYIAIDGDRLRYEWVGTNSYDIVHYALLEVGNLTRATVVSIRGTRTNG